MELHLRYTRLKAEYYDGAKDPFFVEAEAVDGRRYEVGGVEVMRCRCAGWTRTSREYIEDDVKYRHEEWTGTGSGIVFVTEDGKRVEGRG